MLTQKYRRYRDKRGRLIFVEITGGRYYIFRATRKGPEEQSSGYGNRLAAQWELDGRALWNKWPEALVEVPGGVEEVEKR